MPSSLIFFALALVAILIAARRYLARRQLADCGHRTEGTVVRHTVGLPGASRRRSSGRPDRRQYAVVEYDAAGRKCELTASVGALVPTPVGTKLPVLYDPAAPENGRIDTRRELYGQAGVFALFAAGFTAAGIVSLLVNGGVF